MRKKVKALPPMQTWLPTDPVPPIHERVKAALSQGWVEYAALEHAVFPDCWFPKAFRYNSNGGPPGVRWMFSAWLDRNKIPQSFRERHLQRLVGPYPGTSVPVDTVVPNIIRAPSPHPSASHGG